MAIKIDRELLAELGLSSLPAQDVPLFLSHIYETLETRVGQRLADQMTDRQLDEFEAFFDANDDDGAFEWLERNFPNYQQIVSQTFASLKDEIRESAAAILSASARDV